MTGGRGRGRSDAELDRTTALADRGASARERVSSSIDGLTGVYLRGPGTLELEREIARARRTKQPLVLAFVDVDGLKEINDSRGHRAGDRVLLQLADCLKAALRSHDLIIRYGGDEFVCALADADLSFARRRFLNIQSTLEKTHPGASFSSGFAQLDPGDTLEGLIARADAALQQIKRQR
jgi:diguanylate cyclase (GGDEF)-like protein